MIIATKDPTGGNSLNTVLAAQTTGGCLNPNCKARKQSTHTTGDCYWPGGGKEGQFPPNFSQKAKVNVTTTSATTTTPLPSSTSNNSTQVPTQTNYFVLSAQGSATPEEPG